MGNRLALASLLLLAPVVLRAAETSAPAQPPKEAGSEVPAPKIKKVVRPEFPEDVRLAGGGGIVIVTLVIDEHGKVAEASIVRGIPGLDQAALTAVRHWEYQVTRVNGKPVRVRHTVPITFTRTLPQITRAEGIPELRQGGLPSYPPVDVPRVEEVSVEVDLGPEGAVLHAGIKSGRAPYAAALLDAVRRWRFAPDAKNVQVSFRVEARFVPTGKNAPRIDIHLTGLQRSETPIEAPPDPDVPAAPQPSDQGVAEQKAAAPAPEPSPPQTVAASAPREEVINLAPQPEPTPPPVPVSAIPNVTLGPDVPDLLSGRRPVVPPLARMNGVTGNVSVELNVDGAGQATTGAVAGPELLRLAAEEAVKTWLFRRTSVERLHLVATFEYGETTATVTVRQRE
jgi:periplasmic protein TonB